MPRLLIWIKVILVLFFFHIFSLKSLANTEEPSKISRIEIIGNKEVPYDKIFEIISSKPGDPLLKEKIRRDLQSIYDLGFFTDARVNFIDEEGGIRVIFQLFENPVIQKIEISGLKIVSEETFRKLMQTKTGTILNSKLIYGDMISINGHYEGLGFTEPQNHVTDVHWTEEGSLRLTITEGIPITKIIIAGNSVYPTDKLIRLVKIPLGELFNKKLIEEDIGRIADLYNKDDYIIQGLKGTITPLGVVTISVLEAQVESIVVQGNKRTKEKVIRHYIRTKIGEVLKNSRLRKDHQRLQNTGFFEKVEILPEEGSRPGKVKLVFNVKDQKTGFATAGVGFSAGGASRGGGLSGTLSFTERNLGGKGQGVNIGWQKGTLVNVLNLTFLYPLLDEADSTIGITYFNSTLDRQRQVLPNTDPVRFALYRDRRVGGRLTLGRTVFDEDYRMFLTFKTEKLQATSTPTAEFPDIIPNPTSGGLNSITLLNIFDTRDDVFNAHKGVYYSASLENAGHLLGGDFNYLKYTGEIRQYVPHLRKNTIAFRIMAGGSGGELPLAEKFVLGGSDTLRGYTLDRFIGDKFFLASAEYRFPLLKSKILSGAAFFDAGSTWQHGETMSLSTLKSDYGVGIRVSVPGLGLGTIRVDYAIGKEGKRTVIGIGQSF